MAVKWANFHRGQNSAKSGMRYVKVGVNEDADFIFEVIFRLPHVKLGVVSGLGWATGGNSTNTALNFG